MKKLGIICSLVLFAAFMMTFEPSPSHAYGFQYDGAWVTTSGEAQVFTWNIESSLIKAFGVTGSTYTDHASLLTNNMDSVSLYVTYNSTTSTYQMLEFGTDQLIIDLGESDTFYFYFEDSAGTKTYLYDVQNASENAWILASGGAGVYGADIAPDVVPIPPSALLLGSGVVGLIGFGLRRRRNPAL